jgi:outer membrane protein, heavy metal efflux system
MRSSHISFIFLIRLSLRTLSLAIGIGLSACATYTPAPLMPEQSASALIKRKLGSGSWSLVKLQDLAAAQHADIAVARAKLTAAHAALVTAQTRPNPALAWAPTWASNSTDISPWALGFTLDIPIETNGKRAKRIDKAISQNQVATLEVAAATFKARQAVRAAYDDLAATTQQVRLYGQQQAAQEKVVEFLKKRIAAGEASKTESLASRLLLQQTRLLVRQMEKKQAEARADLAAAVGVPIEGLDGAEIDLGSFDASAPLPAAKTARAHALQGRVDVLAAVAAYAVQEADVRLEVAKSFPDVHLTPGFQYDQGTNKWSLPGLSFPLPLTDQNQGPIAESQAKRTELAATVESLQAAAIAAVDKALASLRGAQEKRKEAEKLVAEQQQAMAEIERQAKAGEGDRLSVLTGEVERLAAEVSRIEAQTDARLAEAQLQSATQSPL